MRIPRGKNVFHESFPLKHVNKKTKDKWYFLFSLLEGSPPAPCSRPLGELSKIRPSSTGRSTVLTFLSQQLENKRTLAALMKEMCSKCYFDGSEREPNAHYSHTTPAAPIHLLLFFLIVSGPLHKSFDVKDVVLAIT